ncbi:MAG: hypothetical protein BECKG1743D_GA0114223_112261, partial [Candidatus Kentron sp. G]
RRDGGKNKDCSELHDAIFAPVVTQGRNSGATAVDCEFPNSLLVLLCHITNVIKSFCYVFWLTLTGLETTFEATVHPIASRTIT